MGLVRAKVKSRRVRVRARVRVRGVRARARVWFRMIGQFLGAVLPT